MNIELIKGDITTVEADAVVNAANSSLLGAGGIDGAIHRKAGPELLDACRAIRAKEGGCATGQAVITIAGDLPAKYVIHTVGPVWQDSHHNEADLLRDCYHNSLELALANGVKTIAFPKISTGIYHFPKAAAARIAIAAVRNFHLPEGFDKVIFVCFDAEIMASIKIWAYDPDRGTDFSVWVPSR